MSAAESRLPSLLAVIAGLAALAVGLVWGTWVAGGSDSYCYVEQAERWAAGAMLAAEPLGFEPPWRNQWLPLAPTGFVPSPTTPGALAPICPSGLSLLMVPFRWVGGPAAVFVVVPLLGAVAVWATYLLGAVVGGRLAGVVSAWLLALSPIFLFQVVQPMSDVPATAWLTIAVWLVVRGGQRSLVLAGLATAAAVLTRPVLAPVGIVLAVAIAMRPRPARRPVAGDAGDRRPGAGRLGDVLWFVAGGLPGALLLALLQNALYGSPLSSGYGAATDLFSVAWILPNLGRYTRWLLETQTPFVLLGVVVVAWRGSRWAAGTLLAVAACSAASYLPYQQFEDWSYLRFLLPALPLALVLASTAVFAFARRASMPARWAVALLLIVGLGAWYLHTARTRYAFALRTSEAKFRVAGEYVRDQTPASAVVLAIWHSGSVRYYGHRLSVAWDALSAEELAPVVAVLEARQRPVYLLIEAAEVERFRDTFAAATPLGALDWPARAAFGRELRLYRLADRQRYVEGGAVGTDYRSARE